MSNICGAILQLYNYQGLFFPLISILRCWADSYRNVVFLFFLKEGKSKQSKPIRTRWLWETMTLTQIFNRQQKTRTKEQNLAAKLNKQKINTNTSCGAASIRSNKNSDHDSLSTQWRDREWSRGERQTFNFKITFFPNPFGGEKLNLYSGLAEGDVNILCAICCYLVSGTINYTAVYPIWLTRPSPSELRCSANLISNARKELKFTNAPLQGEQISKNRLVRLINKAIYQSHSNLLFVKISAKMCDSSKGV